MIFPYRVKGFTSSSVERVIFQHFVEKHIIIIYYIGRYS